MALRWADALVVQLVMSALTPALGRHRVGTSRACHWTAEWLVLTVARLARTGLPHAPIDAQLWARGDAVKAA